MKLKKSLNSAMKDEKGAPIMYIQLRGLLKNKKDKRTIDAIIRDERKHLRNLKKIKRRGN